MCKASLAGEALLKLMGNGFWCDLLTGENCYTHIKASPEFEPAHFSITVYSLR